MNLIQDMPVSLKTPISILRANITDMNMHVNCPETKRYTAEGGIQ